MADLTAETVLATLQPIFAEILDNPEIEISRGSNASNTLNWDSLAHLEIIESAQRRFRLKFSLSDLQKLNNVGDLVDLVLEKSRVR
jgi:acyl carrier protein